MYFRLQPELLPWYFRGDIRDRVFPASFCNADKDDNVKYSSITGTIEYDPSEEPFSRRVEWATWKLGKGTILDPFPHWIFCEEGEMCLDAVTQSNTTMPPLAFCVSGSALVTLADLIVPKFNTSSHNETKQGPPSELWEQLPHHWRHITWMDRDPFRTNTSSGWYLSGSPNSSSSSSGSSLFGSQELEKLDIKV
ncbi:MAG: hypothetical protein M1821_006314 [Bathelium mastoideum]|nr:MAG: hypothetical protein M1821_006314 [Bathelium mastoideum]KAI9693590.1 MAG: hypothetical protein M1822_002861 [Bathelium mastoideum]